MERAAVNSVVAVFTYVGPYHLMAGYAIESLLKAVRVKRLVVASVKKIPFGNDSPDKVPTNHQYTAFAKAEIGNLSGGEQDRLERLGTYVLWAGRYPAAKSAKAMDTGGNSTKRDDHDVVHAIARRIIDKYESLN